jgi:hypothetical protein
MCYQYYVELNMLPQQDGVSVRKNSAARATSVRKHQHSETEFQ